MSTLYQYNEHLSKTLVQGDEYWCIVDGEELGENVPAKFVFESEVDQEIIRKNIVFLTEEGCIEFIKDKCLNC